MGGSHQAGDWSGDGVGRPHAQPHRANHGEEHALQVGQQERCLDLMAVGLRLPVVLQSPGRGREVADDPRLHPADRIDIGVWIGLQPIEAADQRLLLEGLFRHIALVGPVDRVRRRGDEGRRSVVGGAGQHAALVVQDVDRRERPHPRLDLKHPPERHRARAEHRLIPIEVDGRRLQVGRQVLSLLVEIGLGHGRGVLHHRTHPLGEPVLDPAGDQGSEEQGHDDRGHNGGQGEHSHEAPVQARARVAATLAQHLDHAPADRRGQREDQDEVAEDGGQDDAAGRAGLAGSGGAGREIDGGDGQKNRDAVADAEDEARLHPAPPARGDAI